MAGIRPAWWLIIAGFGLGALMAIVMCAVLAVSGGDIHTGKAVFRAAYPVVAPLSVILLAVGAITLIVQRPGTTDD